MGQQRAVASCQSCYETARMIMAGEEKSTPYGKTANYDFAVSRALQDSTVIQTRNTTLQALENGHLITDRTVLENLAWQCAKCPGSFFKTPVYKALQEAHEKEVSESKK